MNVNAPHSFPVQCDWLTLATYKFSPYTKFAAFLRELPGMKWNGAKWLQYEGFSNGDGIFHGHATQSNMKEHYIVKVTGKNAAELLPAILEQPFAENFYATRIDVQLTRKPPDWWDARTVKDWLDIHGRASSMIESNTSTIYIGNRKSGRFTRLYEKDYSTRYLRMEIELKKSHARVAWNYLLDGASIRSVYASHLARVPLAQQWYEDYLPAESMDLDLTLYEKVVDSEKKLEWLMTLVSTFQKMANDHDIGERTRAIFYSLWYLDEDDKNEYVD